MSQELITSSNKLRKINNKLQIIQQQTTNFLQNYSNGTDYLITYTKDIQKKKLEGEIILDKVDQSYKKLTEIISISKELKEKFSKKIDKFIETCENEKDLLAKNNNEIIKQLNQLNDILVNNIEIRKTLNKQNEMLYKEEPNEEIERLKNELQKEKLKQLERFNLTSIEKNQLEEWTGRKITEVIFNSDYHDWKCNTSVFGAIVMDKPKLILMIEDMKGNKFGAFNSNPISKVGGFTYDSNAFVFSLQSKGRLNEMKKFPISKSSEAFFMYPRNHHWLISIGSDGGKNGKDDITIMKQDCQYISPGNGCVQYTYQYYGIENALCGSSSFSVKQIERFFFIRFLLSALKNVI